MPAWLGPAAGLAVAAGPGVAGKEALEEEGESKIAEATGMLAGLGTLLPAEKVAAPGELEPATDDLDKAAQAFFAIATQAPQPATLPAPLTRREKVLGGTARTILLILFLGLITLPLIPAAQKVVDPETDRRAPWTEPVGTQSEVLDSQRRQLISEQLGVIDLQQPDNVALISFDYNAATQGEMEPLAEAVVGRLKGQGMRLIVVSLDLEGAAMARRVLDKITAEDQDAAAKIVNLGYLPGQIAALRVLMTDVTLFAPVAEGLSLGDPAGKAGWEDVKSFDQVDLVVSLADNPVTARWWVEQLEVAPPPPNGEERFFLAATSASADPFLRPYRENGQIDGLISGINGAAAIESARQNFGPARQMLDSQSIAHLILVILIALGTMIGWMPSEAPPAPREDD
jgi:hypothetical protein